MAKLPRDKRKQTGSVIGALLNSGAFRFALLKTIQASSSECSLQPADRTDLPSAENSLPSFA